MYIPPKLSFLSVYRALYIHVYATTLFIDYIYHDFPKCILNYFYPDDLGIGNFGCTLALPLA